MDVIDLVSKAKALVEERDKLDNKERETKRRHLIASSDSSCEQSNEFTEISNDSSMSNPTPGVGSLFLYGNPVECNVKKRHMTLTLCRTYE